MSTQEFSSTSAVTQTLLDNTITSLAGVIPNSVFKNVMDISKIFENPKDIINVEWQAGESLGKIATEYLNNSFAWQVLADVNGLDAMGEIDIGTILKIPTEAAILNSVKRFVVNSPESKKFIEDIKGSILDLSSIGGSTPFAQNLKDCIGKIIDFKTVLN